MSGIANQLAQLPYLAEVPLEELRDSARFWRQSVLKPGDHFCQEGEPANELALVLEGELSALVEQQEVGRVSQGEMIGEVATFLGGATSSATVLAETQCVLLGLRRASLLALRRQRSPLYDALLDAGLRTLCERVRATDAMIAELCQSGGVPQEPEDDPSDLPPRPDEPPEVMPLLRGLSSLAGAEDAVLGPLAEAFEPVAFSVGDELVSEGLPGDSAFLVAAGQVEVRRELRDGQPGRLTTLRAGDLVGFNSLIDDGPRSATLVAVTDGWLHRITAARHKALDETALLSWREALLATLATQLRVANAIVSGARRLGVSRALVRTQDYRALLEASGVLVGLPVSETEEEPLPASQTDPLSIPP